MRPDSTHTVPCLVYTPKKHDYQHLQQMVVQTKRLNIDDNQGCLSGFSDGGKTVFNVASLLPTLFQHLHSRSRQPLPTTLTYSRGFNLRELTGLDWLQLVVSTTRQPTASHQTDSVRVINTAGEVSRYQAGVAAGQVRAACFSNIYTLETLLVDEVALYVSPVLVDLPQPIRVIVNGQEHFNGRVAASKAFVGQQFQASINRQQLFVNELRIEL